MSADGDAPTRSAPLRRSDILVFLVLALGTALFVAGTLDRPVRVVHDAVVARAVVVDPDGSLDAVAALARPAVPYRGVFNGGYVPFVHWLVLTVAPGEEGRVLRVVPPYLDEVDVYRVDPEHGPVPLAAIGDRRAVAPPSVASVVPNVVLPAMPEGGTLLLRVRTTSSSLVAADVVSRTRFERGAVRQTLLLAVYLALLAMMIAWVLFERRSREAGLWWWFVAYQGFAAGFALGNLGVWPFLLPPTWTGVADALTSLSLMLYVATGFVFYGRLLAPFEAPRWLRTVSYALALGPIATAVAYVAGAELVALRANALIVLAFAPFAFAAAATVRSGGGGLIALARGSYLAIGTVVLLQALPLLGFVPAGPLVAYGGMLVPVVGAVVVVWLLARRSHALRRDAHEARERVASAEQRARGEAAGRRASERFVGVLASTVRTPLSVIGLALGRRGAPSERALALARDAADDVRKVLERVEVVARLEAGAVEVVRTPSDVATLVAAAVVRHGLDDRVELDGDGDVAAVDRDVLERVLVELLDNAVRYGAAEPEVRVGWRVHEAALHLWVVSPIGALAAIEADRAFEKYARGERAGATTGAGLGLYAVQRLARLHGGDATLVVDDGWVRVEAVLAC